MRKRPIWAKLSYKLWNNNKLIIDKRNTACFSDLKNSNNYTHMEIYDILCKTTEKYYHFYLQYIADMLKLEDVEIGENSFKFKAYPESNKNMLVGSLVRFLFEKFGCIEQPQIDLSKELFEPLKNGKSKYRNKLKRFCDFYSRINIKNRYFSTGHSWEPSKTEIKSTQDWLKHKKWQGYGTVNDFFTK